ncbi:MAG: hypothetical protein Q9168_006062 [Polycauliona sp. 1 TL-2023]
MTWDDGEKNFFSTLLSSMRMGPIGYILGSPYSPLRVEQEIPSRNWREAFEDLLAIDTRGSMILEAHRKAENTFWAKQNYDFASGDITRFNASIKEYQKVERRTADLGKVATAHGDKEKAAWVESEARPGIKAIITDMATHAQAIALGYESMQDKPASRQKHYGQWIASLVNSGALPGWSWREIISMDGAVMAFKRVDAPPELEVGIEFSEKELWAHFVEGVPHKIASSQPLPLNQLKALSDGVIQSPRTRTGPWMPFDPSPASIIAQYGRAEAFKQRDGSTGTRVYLANELVNGKRVEQVFDQEPTKVLEETLFAKRSMGSVRALLMGEGSIDHEEALHLINKGIDDKLASYEDNSFF